MPPTLFEPAATHRGALYWPLDGCSVLSSAPVGGGMTTPDWILNVGVPADFARTDLSQFAAEVADDLGLAGSGVTMLTAASVRQFSCGESDDVTACATVGITKPTWAADPGGGWNDWVPGTINIVVALPVALAPAAAVNAVVTATEAKTQALLEAGVPGTGTASDAISIAWPQQGEVAPFAGPRSVWGSAIAQAVHQAVANGIHPGGVASSAGETGVDS